VLKACSNFVRGWVQGGDNQDRAEQTAQAILHIAQAQDEAEVYGRFMGGLFRNKRNSGRCGQIEHFMQSVQSRINTGCFASS
jgi:ribosomal protein S2